MAKTPEQFAAWVKRLEAYAAQHPARYRLKLALLAGAGYTYIFLILIVLLAMLTLLALAVRSGGFVVIKIGIAILVLTGTILRALWVRLPAPEGLALTAAQVPQLFRTVEETRRALRAPRIHTVLLTMDFNAGVVEYPRLGIFGWPRRYLLLGMPLMLALPADQFRAVLAHEFGHVSGNHGRFASWIYRVRKTWFRLLVQLQGQNKFGASLFAAFARWYGPLFNAYSFVMARAHEYEADRCAAEVAGSKTAAEALLSTAVQERFLDYSFWPETGRRMVAEPNPPAGVLTSMGESLRTSLSRPDAVKWMEQALHGQTGYADTHPALGDRLGALGFLDGPAATAEGFKVFGLASFQRSAAEALLGTAAGSLAARLGSDWQKQVGPKWRDGHRHFLEVKAELEKVETKARTEALNEEESWCRAAWTAELQGPPAAELLYREVLRLNPQHASANFMLGQILLDQDNEEGIDLLQKLIETDPESVIPACELIYSFLLRKGRVEEAENYKARAVRQHAMLLKAQEEREGAKHDEPYIPHGLLPEAIRSLVERLGWQQDLERAFLVRKDVRFLPDCPFFVLGVVRRRGWVESSDQAKAKDQDLVNRLISLRVFPGQTLIVILSRANSKLRKALEKVPQSEIFRR